MTYVSPLISLTCTASISSLPPACEQQHRSSSFIYSCTFFNVDFRTYYSSLNPISPQTFCKHPLPLPSSRTFPSGDESRRAAATPSNLIEGNSENEKKGGDWIESAVQEYHFKTAHGSVSVIIYGDRDEPGLVTYPNLALNRCFFAAPQLLHYHISPPGHELGASAICPNDSVPYAENLADQILQVLNFFRLDTVMFMGATTGAYILSLFAGLGLENEVSHAPALWFDSLNNISFVENHDFPKSDDGRCVSQSAQLLADSMVTSCVHFVIISSSLMAN